MGLMDWITGSFRPPAGALARDLAIVNQLPHIAALLARAEAAGKRPIAESIFWHSHQPNTYIWIPDAWASCLSLLAYLDEFDSPSAEPHPLHANAQQLLEHGCWIVTVSYRNALEHMWHLERLGAVPHGFLRQGMLEELGQSPAAWDRDTDLMPPLDVLALTRCEGYLKLVAQAMGRHSLKTLHNELLVRPPAGWTHDPAAALTALTGLPPPHPQLVPRIEALGGKPARQMARTRRRIELVLNALHKGVAAGRRPPN